MNNTTVTPCSRWAEKLAMVHPDDLSPSEHQEFETHLATCSKCAAVRTQYDEIVALLNDLPAEDMPVGLPPRLLQAWENEAILRELRKPAVVRTGTSRTRPATRNRRLIRAMSAIAAVLIVGVLSGYFVVHLPGGRESGPTGPSSPLGGLGLIIAYTPVFSQSNVYINTGSVIAAYRSNNGSLIRTYSIGNSKNSRVNSLEPVIVNGIMYVIGTTYPGPGSPGIDGIYALRLSDGAILWHTIVGDIKSLPPTIANAITVAGGIVYVTINAHSEYLYALRASDGMLLWKYKAGKPYEAEVTLPAVAHGVAYVGLSDTQNAYLVALNTGDGQLLWKRKVGEQFVAPTIADGVIYAGTRGFVSALRASDGMLLWQYNTGGLTGVPTVTDGVVYAISNNGYIYALQASNGALLWNHKLGNSLPVSVSHASAPIVVNGIVFMGAFTGFGSAEGSHIYALSIRNGHVIWQYKVGSNVIPSLAYGNGAIYFESLPRIPNQLHALRAGNGAVLWHTDIPN